MGDRYGKLVEDVGYRQDQVKRTGLGFELPESVIWATWATNFGGNCCSVMNNPMKIR
jgi:hypothetical protein